MMNFFQSPKMMRMPSSNYQTKLETDLTNVLLDMGKLQNNNSIIGCMNCLKNLDDLLQQIQTIPIYQQQYLMDIHKYIDGEKISIIGYCLLEALTKSSDSFFYHSLILRILQKVPTFELTDKDLKIITQVYCTYQKDPKKYQQQISNLNKILLAIDITSLDVPAFVKTMNPFSRLSFAFNKSYCIDKASATDTNGEIRHGAVSANDLLSYKIYEFKMVYDKEKNETISSQMTSSQYDDIYRNKIAERLANSNIGQLSPSERLLMMILLQLRTQQDLTFALNELGPILGQQIKTDTYFITNLKGAILNQKQGGKRQRRHSKRRTKRRTKKSRFAKKSRRYRSA